MMSANKIITADILDIIFDGRFKDYGAYQLRRKYNNRLIASLTAVIGGCSLILVLTAPGGKGVENTSGIVLPPDTVKLITLPETRKPEVMPSPQPAQQVRQVVFATPVIVTETSPVEEIADAVIGTITLDGPHGSLMTPPAEVPTTGTGVLPVAPLYPPDTIFRAAEHPAIFPGDWKRFLERNLVYPEAAVENGTQGVVKVEFVINKNGFISDIKALNDPGDGLAAEAIRIIKKCPQWKPAEQNGQRVNFRNVLIITFRLN